MILVGVLPPLLDATAIRTPLVDFRSNARPIALLSVGLAVFTTLGVGVLARWLLPVPFAAGFALGAVVGHPTQSLPRRSPGESVFPPRRDHPRG